MKIKTVTIIGGGSSGWMSAAALSKLCPHLEVTVVESKDVPTVGVGESTLGHFNTYLQLLGLKDEDWMPACKATYKNSIRFTNFAKKDGKSFEYPFISGFDWSYTPNGLNDWGELAALFPDEFDNTSFAKMYAPSNTLLAMYNKEDNNANGNLGPNYDFANDTAYHLDAQLFGQYLKETICIPNGVKIIENTIHSYDVDDKENITKILCKDGSTLYSDLWIDCTGFKSMLLEKWMGEEFKTFEDKLANDAAWAVRIPYTDRENQLENVTDCTALDNGWVWNIPLWDRIGTGYVFSTRFVEPNTALREFLKHIKERYPDIDLDTVEPFYIPIKHGYRRKAWSKNVVGIGLSYGFVEPLESTGLLTTHENIIKLVDTLNRREGYTTQIERDAFNGMCQKNVLTFRDFVAMHYAGSGRTDTNYWRWATQKNQYAPTILGPRMIRNANIENFFGAIQEHVMLDIDQGANFIGAGLGVKPVSTPEYVYVKNKGDVRHLHKIKDAYQDNFKKLETYVKGLPSTYEYLRDNIYKDIDAN
jgi:tryptophan halogenase